MTMKKTLLIGFILLLLAACTNQPAENNNMSAANANKPAEPKTAMVSDAEITAKEKAAWEAIKKKDWAGFEKMVASDYIEVLDDGVHDKAATMTMVKDIELTDVTFADWKTIPVDKVTVLITYSATVKGSFKGKPVPPGPYREASAYVNRDGQWLSVYYQETLSKTMPPPPSPAKAEPKPSKPATPAATSTAKVPDAGPDAVANEKLVWDSLKAKNYQRFASYLAPDSMEIEAEGVYDKAGSEKGVSMFDFSKSELSDWKSMKLSDTASLVIYKVKSPGMKPDTEYHSTIWINRTGKWMALFHMGTPAAAAAN
jgi:hypothetical protein